MLFKISVKNIRKSFKDYAVYFFTLILGVAVFYVFNAIDSQTVMLDVRKNVYDIMKLMNEIESDYDGVVTDILVDNEQMVEYGQPMFVIKPV